MFLGSLNRKEKSTLKNTCRRETSTHPLPGEANTKPRDRGEDSNRVSDGAGAGESRLPRGVCWGQAPFPSRDPRLRAPHPAGLPWPTPLTGGAVSKADSLWRLRCTGHPIATLNFTESPAKAPELAILPDSSRHWGTELTFFFFLNSPCPHGAYTVREYSRIKVFLGCKLDVEENSLPTGRQTPSLKPKSRWNPFTVTCTGQGEASVSSSLLTNDAGRLSQGQQLWLAGWPFSETRLLLSVLQGHQSGVLK